MSFISWKHHAIQVTPPAFMIGKPRSREPNNGINSEVIFNHGRTLFMQHVLIPSFTYDRGYPYLGASKNDRPQAAFAKCHNVEFPSPRYDDKNYININMMPFIMGDMNSLPENVQHYYDGVIQKCPISGKEVGRVGFLTISEGMVHANQTQR